jgi:hypothetical protein
MSRSAPTRPRTCSSFADAVVRLRSVFADFHSARAFSYSDDSSFAETKALTSGTISSRAEPKSDSVR